MKFMSVKMHAISLNRYLTCVGIWKNFTILNHVYKIECLNNSVLTPRETKSSKKSSYIIPIPNLVFHFLWNCSVFIVNIRYFLKGWIKKKLNLITFYQTLLPYIILCFVLQADFIFIVYSEEFDCSYFFVSNGKIQNWAVTDGRFLCVT